MADGVWNSYYAPFLRDHGQSPAAYADDPKLRYQAIQSMYWDVLTELCTNRFKWTNLPESVDPRYLEMILFNKALAVFFKDEITGKYLVQQAMPAGNNLNIYQNPTKYTIVGTSARRFATRPADTLVPIWGNYLRRPHDLNKVMIYSARLADIDRTLEINALQIRQQKVIVAPEVSKRHTMTQIAADIASGAPEIKINEAALMENIQVLDMQLDPKQLGDTHIYRTRMFAEVLGLLGIDNANVDKKERLVADEVDANKSQVSATRRIALNARQQACEKINAKYDLPHPISVDYNPEIVDMVEDATSTITMGGPNA